MGRAAQQLPQSIVALLPAVPIPSAAEWDGDGCAVAAGGTVGLAMAWWLPPSWGPPALLSPAQLLGFSLLSAAFQASCGCRVVVLCCLCSLLGSEDGSSPV